MHQGKKVGFVGFVSVGQSLLVAPLNDTSGLCDGKSPVLGSVQLRQIVFRLKQVQTQLSSLSYWPAKPSSYSVCTPL